MRSSDLPQQQRTIKKGSRNDGTNRKQSEGRLVTYFRAIRDGMSLRACAKEANMSHTNLSLIEKGRKTPSQNEIENIAKALGLTSVEKAQLEDSFFHTEKLPSYQICSFREIWDEIRISRRCIIAATNMEIFAKQDYEYLTGGLNQDVKYRFFLSEPESYPSLKQQDRQDDLEIIAVPHLQRGICIPVRILLEGNRNLLGAYGLLDEKDGASSFMPMLPQNQIGESQKNAALLDAIRNQARTNLEMDTNRPRIIYPHSRSL